MQILYLHKKDKTLSMGSFIHGKFDDEVVPKQTMYTINTRTVKKMELNDIGMIEVNVSNCELISICDTSRIAIWIHHDMKDDNDN